MVRRKDRQLSLSTRTRFGLMRLANLHMVREARRTGASPQSEALAKPVRPEAMTEDRGAWGDWRRNDRKLTDVNQGRLLWRHEEQSRNQSPHSSDEAANHRRAKGDRKVNA
jgi:hypothetical protein